jgi:hypothetical protein
MKLHQLYAMKTRALAEGRLRAYHRILRAIDRRIAYLSVAA